MSSRVFDAFSRYGTDVGGEKAVAALRAYFLEKNLGARMAPNRIAKALDLDEEVVDDLLNIAAGSEVGLLEDASQIQCPFCQGRVDLRILRQQRDAGEDVLCPDCAHPIDDFERLEVERRYRLTASAAAEAAQWQEQRAARPKMQAVILTALVEELGAVRDQLIASGVTLTERTVANGGIYYEATFEGVDVDWTIHASFTQATVGKAAAGAVDAILNFKPNIAMFVGIAGGIAEKGVKLGDVIAATEVFDYEQGKDTATGFIPRTYQLHTAFSLNQLAAFTILADSWRSRISTTVEGLELEQPMVHAEPIAAGGKVVASTESATYKLVRQTADRVVAVEMEGSGFLGAVGRYHAVDGIVIRGASDLIDGKSESDKGGVRKQAVANAAAFAFEMLHRFKKPGAP
jgi:nucleoside phosphorylase